MSALCRYSVLYIIGKSDAPFYNNNSTTLSAHHTRTLTVPQLYPIMKVNGHQNVFLEQKQQTHRLLGTEPSRSLSVSLSDMLSAGTVLNKKWTIAGHLGGGACAEVYDLRERDPDTGSPLVAKCIPLPSAKAKKAEQKIQARVADTLFYEHTLYTNGLLYGFDHAPKIPRMAYGEDHGHRFMVMEKLDCDLRALAGRAPPPDNAKIAEIGLQLLEGLRFIHEKGYVFVDVKPDNFMLKGVDGRDKIFFIDFGLMEKLRGYMAGGALREMVKRDVVAGTPAFASLAVHEGCTPSMRDDVEAMAYVLIALTSRDCSLPWIGPHVHSDSQCLQIKRSTDIAEICRTRGCEELSDIVEICRSTSYSASPDYDRIKAILERLKISRPKRRASSSSAKTDRGSAVDRLEVRRKASIGETVDLTNPSDGKSSKRVKTEGLKACGETPILYETPSEPVSMKRSARGNPQKMVADVPRMEQSDVVLKVIGGPCLTSQLQMMMPSSEKVAVRTRRGAKTRRAPDDVNFSDCVLIGRSCSDAESPHCFRLEADDYVSDSHAFIQLFKNDKNSQCFLIYDVDSTNGTKLNNVKIPQRSWVEGRIGDTFRIGTSTLQLAIKDQTASSIS